MSLRNAFQKTFHIFFFEYRRQVFRWRFWLSLFGTPLVVLALAGGLVLAILLGRDHSPVGVVGPAGLNLSGVPGEPMSYTFRLFPDESTAQTALLTGQIQAYYVLPPDYPLHREANLVYLTRPSDGMTTELNNLLRWGLLADMPPERAMRLVSGAHVILQSGSLQAPAQISALFKLVVAFGAAYILMGMISSSSGFMIHTLTDERANRTLEILVTSVSHYQLMIGKIAGQIGVVFTQGLILGGTPLVGMIVLSQLAAPVLGELFSLQQALVFAVMGLLSFVFESVLLSALSVTVMEPSDTSLVSMFFSLIGMLPLLLFQALSNAPDGPVSIFLSLFPLSSAATLIMRMAMGSVPFWQILLSLVLLLGCTWWALWLAGRMLWLSLNDRTPQKRLMRRLQAIFRRVWRPRHA